jgi:hypothetical protein
MSRILSADDLNDFIGPVPSIFCSFTDIDRAKSVLSRLKSSRQGMPMRYCAFRVLITNGKQSEIQADGQGGYYEVTKDGQSTKLKEATISLNDCLACRYVAFP